MQRVHIPPPPLIRLPRCLRRPLLAGLGSLLAVAAAVAAAVAPVRATAAEAGAASAYIVGFVRYVRWLDEEALPAWTLCTPDELPAEQGAAYAGQTVRGKPFVARRVGMDESLAGCQVLDLTRVDADSARALLQRSRGQPILSVGRGAEFCSAGGLICLRPVGSERKFEVNLSAVKASGLKASARLLMLGTDRPLRSAAP